MKLINLLLLLGGLALIAACTSSSAAPVSTSTPPPPPQPTAPLVGTRWSLVSLGPATSPTPVIPGSAITLEFETNNRLGGSGGCNSYSGEYQIQGNRITTNQIVSTLRACGDDKVTEQEQRYIQALRAAETFQETTRAGETQLSITYSNGAGVLNFARGSSAPVTPRAGTPVAGATGRAVEAVSNSLPLATPRRGTPAPTPQTPPADAARVPGILDFSAARTQDDLTAPETVRRGEAFEIKVITFGSGCEEGGDTSVLLTESVANVMVYDFTTATRPGVACTAILKRMPHTATLRFTEPGEALIRVWGRRVGPDTPPEGVPTLIEHSIQVQ